MRDPDVEIEIPPDTGEWLPLSYRQDSAGLFQEAQIDIYGDLVRRLVPGKSLKLRFAVITKTKEPKVQVLVAEFDAERLDRTKAVFKAVWSAIQTGNFYPSPSPRRPR